MDRNSGARHHQRYADAGRGYTAWQDAMDRRVSALEDRLEKVVDTQGEGFRWAEGEHSAIRQSLSDRTEALNNAMMRGALGAQRETYEVGRGLQEQIIAAIREGLEGQTTTAKELGATQLQFWQQSSTWMWAIIIVVVTVFAQHLLHF